MDKLLALENVCVGVNMAAESVDRAAHKFGIYLSSIVYRSDMHCPHKEENPPRRQYSKRTSHIWADYGFLVFSAQHDQLAGPLCSGVQLSSAEAGVGREAGRKLAKTENPDRKPMPMAQQLQH